MAVKILITLEGAEQINTALQDLTKRGEDFMQTFQGLGQGATALENVSVQMQNVAENAGKGLDQATEATHTFTEGIRILIPVMRAAGVEVANFSGFARLASIGLGGLAAAVSGAVIVALASLEEQAARTQALLSGLFGSRELGAQAFAAIEEGAQGLKTTVSGLAPVFQAATAALQRFVQASQGFKFVALQGVDLPKGTAGNIKDTSDAVINFIKILRAGGEDEANAEKQSLAFFNSMKEGGKVTADSLKQLDPGAIRLFAEAMGRGSISSEQFISEVGLAPIPLNRFMEALQRFGPQARKAFDTEAVKSFHDELRALLNDIQKASKQTFGVSVDQGFINFIHDLRKEVPGTASDLRVLASLIAPILKSLQDLRQQAGAPPTQTRQLPDNFKQIPEQAQKAIDDSIVIFQNGLTKLSINLTSSPFAQDIAKVLDSLPQHLQIALINLPNMFAEVFGNISNIVKAAWSSIVAIFTSDIAGRIGAALSGIAPAIEDIWSTVAADTRQTWQQISDVISRAWDRIKEIFNADISSKIIAAFTAVPEALAEIWSAFSEDAKAAWESVTNAAQAAKDNIIAFFATPIDLSVFFSGFQTAWDNVVQAARSAYDTITSIFSNPVAVQLQTSGGTGGPLLSGFDSGGLVRGPGTHTSDSILAWLSNNEFIQPAKAVQFYGLDFMEAVRKMQLPRNFFEGFNMGGLVREMVGSIPKFAQGGQAQMAPVTLVIDRQRFNMSASADTVKALNRYAISTQVTSGGRKPSWVR